MEFLPSFPLQVSTLFFFGFLLFCGAYPISTLTWVLAYKTGNGAKADDIQKALNYALSAKAQMIADDLGYVPLAGSILNKSRLAVKRIAN